MLKKNAENVCLNMTRRRKGRAKDIEREAQLDETIRQRGNMPETQGKVHLCISRSFKEHPLDSRGKPSANGTIQNAHEKHSGAQTEISVRKDKHKILTSEFGQGKIQRHISIFERDPNRWEKRKIPKCTSLQHTAPKLRTELYTNKRKRQRYSQNKLLQELRPYTGEEYHRLGDTSKKEGGS